MFDKSKNDKHKKENEEIISAHWGSNGVQAMLQLIDCRLEELKEGRLKSNSEQTLGQAIELKRLYDDISNLKPKA